MPTDRFARANVAFPLVSAEEPIELCPSYRVTVPVGVQEYCGATVTVNVTSCWNTDGLASALTLVVVFALFICNVNPCVPEFLGVAESKTVALTAYEPAAAHVLPEIVGETGVCCEIPLGRPVTFHVNVGGVPPSSVRVVVG